MGDFFVSKNDKALAEAIVSQSTDLYIMPVANEGTGVLDLTTPAAATLTDTGLSLTIDAEVGKILMFGGCEFIVVSNTATTYTFDSTSDVDGNDKSSVLTDAASYDYRQLDTEEFVGYTDESTFLDEEEVKEFKTGVPRKKVREDLLEKTTSLNTIIRVPSPGTLKSAYNLKDNNSNATYYVLEGGSNPGNRAIYYLVAKNVNVSNKAQQLRMYYCQIKPNGERTLGGGEDYEQIPVSIAVNADPLRSDATDRYRIRIEK